MRRKLLNLWRVITFRWINTEVSEPKNYLKVEVLNEDSDILHEVLGITDERKDDLTRECESLLAKYEDTSRAASELSKQMLHANELFYCSYLIAHIVEHKKRAGNMAHMMASLFKPRGKGDKDQSED